MMETYRRQIRKLEEAKVTGLHPDLGTPLDARQISQLDDVLNRVRTKLKNRDY